MFSETSNRKGALFKKLKSTFSVRRRKNTPDNLNNDQYFYITNFEQINDKECLEYDRLNQEIYLSNLKLFNDTNKKLLNTPFELTNKPEPPLRPNNYEKLYLWRQRNVKRNVHEQSLAIIYLLTKNIRIKFSESKYEGVEPFNAINIANKIAVENNEDIVKIVHNYLSNIETGDIELNKIKEKQKITSEKSPNNMKCNYPEHHHINDKINYFETTTNNALYPALGGYPVLGAPTAPPSNFKPPSYNDMDKLI